MSITQIKKDIKIYEELLTKSNNKYTIEYCVFNLNQLRIQLKYLKNKLCKR